MPRCAVAESLSERHGSGMARVNQTRQYCVNQMEKTQPKPLAAGPGRGMGTVWYVRICVFLTLSVSAEYIYSSLSHQLSGQSVDPLLVQFKSLLPGQEGCVFFSPQQD
jgi:hypothetical protein